PRSLRRSPDRTIKRAKKQLDDSRCCWRRGTGGNGCRLLLGNGFHNGKTLFDFVVIVGEVGQLKDQMVVTECSHFIELAKTTRYRDEQWREPAHRNSAHAGVHDNCGRHGLRIVREVSYGLLD